MSMVRPGCSSSFQQCPRYSAWSLRCIRAPWSIHTHPGQGAASNISTKGAYASASTAALGTAQSEKNMGSAIEGTGLGARSDLVLEESSPTI